MKTVNEILHFVVYKIINIDNKKIYIGKTRVSKTWKPEYRFSEHLSLANLGSLDCPKLYNSIRKYGTDKFQFEIINVFNNEEMAYIAEQKYIEEYNSMLDGLNTTPGGKGVGSGKNNPNFGKKHTEEFKKQVSYKIKARNSTPEYKEKYAILLGGENCYKSKLTNDNVVVIKKILKEKKLSHAQIAKKYNVTKQTITLINTGKTWKNIII